MLSFIFHLTLLNQMGRTNHFNFPRNIRQLQGNTMEQNANSNAFGSIWRIPTEYAVQYVIRGTISWILGKYSINFHSYSSTTFTKNMYKPLKWYWLKNKWWNLILVQSHLFELHNLIFDDFSLTCHHWIYSSNQKYPG